MRHHIGCPEALLVRISLHAHRCHTVPRGGSVASRHMSGTKATVPRTPPLVERCCAEVNPGMMTPCQTAFASQIPKRHRVSQVDENATRFRNIRGLEGVSCSQTPLRRDNKMSSALPSSAFVCSLPPSLPDCWFAPRTPAQQFTGENSCTPLPPRAHALVSVHCKVQHAQLLQLLQGGGARRHLLVRGALIHRRIRVHEPCENHLGFA